MIYQKDLSSRYIDAISKQIENLPARPSSIYIGGGTPTTLDNDSLERLLKCLEKYAGAGVEFTVEANPESLTGDKIKLFLDHGVNRLSIGCQSFNDKKLEVLGRVHDSVQAKASVMLAAKKGFKNISADLIYGVWNESMEEWKHDVDEAARLPVTHISCYGLTYEKGTPLFGALRNKTVQPIDDGIASAMYEYAIDRLAVRGFVQYEISNFAKDGYMCKHNMNYWYNNPYIGIGASAVSYIDGARKQNISDVEEYIRKADDGDEAIASSEKLDPVGRAKETAAVKIRTKEGIDFAWFKAHTGYDFQALEKNALRELLEKDLIK